MATWERRPRVKLPSLAGQRLFERHSGVRRREFALVTLTVISTALWVASALPRSPSESARQATEPPAEVSAPPAAAVVDPPAVVNTPLVPQAPPAMVKMPQQRSTPVVQRGPARKLKPSGFAVNFGQFADRPSALRQARTIRSKGYVASVVRTGSAYRVISRPYVARQEAEFWAGIFEQIGIPGRPRSLQ